MHQCINIEAGICVARCCHHGKQWSRIIYEIYLFYFFWISVMARSIVLKKIYIVKEFKNSNVTPLNLWHQCACHTIKHSRHFITGVGAVSTRILAQTSCCCKLFQKAAAIFPPFFFLSWTAQCSAVGFIRMCVCMCNDTA